MATKNIGIIDSVFALMCFAFGCSPGLAAPPDFAPPDAAAVSITTPEGISKQITFSASDTHLVGTFTYAVKSSPAHGQVSVVNGDHVT